MVQRSNRRRRSPERPQARLSIAFAVLGLILLVASGPLHRMGVPLRVALIVFGSAAFAGLAAIALAMFGVTSGWRRGRRVLKPASIGIVLGLIAVGVPYQWWRAARQAPPIHDVSTDLVNPPTFEAVVPLRVNAPNRLDVDLKVAAQQRRGYPAIGPLTLTGTPDAIFDRALAAARASRWQIVKADKRNGRIEATATTFWFGFKDDVVVRLTREQDLVRVDVRSVSRIGGGDAGTNARRIRRYFDTVRASGIGGA